MSEDSDEDKSEDEEDRLIRQLRELRMFVGENEECIKEVLDIDGENANPENAEMMDGALKGDTSALTRMKTAIAGMLNKQKDKEEHFADQILEKAQLQ